MSRNSSSANKQSALKFCGNFLPVNIFSTPLNGDIRNCVNPELAMSEPTHPMNDTKLCIPPSIGTKFFYFSCFHQVSCCAMR